MVPTLCVVVTVLLGFQAALSLLNPQSIFDPRRNAFLPLPAYVPFLPTTVDTQTGWTFSMEMLAYLCVVVVAADLSQMARWRHRCVSGIAFTGVAVSLAGLCLKTGCFPHIDAYLEDRPWAQGQIFGPFDYHGNAGAFLNLTLPFVAASAAMSGHLRRRLGWRIALGLVYLALFVNGSRAALVIGLFLSPLCLWIARPTISKSPAANGATRHHLRTALLSILLVTFVIVGLFTALRGSRLLKRLHHLTVELREPEYPRYMQSRAAWEMAQERPMFGAGVGSYKVLVQTSSIRGYFFAPYFRPGDPFTVLGHTHEDYLQTLVEWGWIGFGGWTVLVAGAFITLWKLLRRTGFTSRTALALGVGLVGVYSHALGDCPLQIPVIQFYVALCLGMAWGSGGWQKSPLANLARQTISQECVTHRSHQ